MLKFVVLRKRKCTFDRKIKYYGLGIKDVIKNNESRKTLKSKKHYENIQFSNYFSMALA